MYYLIGVARYKDTPQRHSFFEYRTKSDNYLTQQSFPTKGNSFPLREDYRYVLLFLDLINRATVSGEMHQIRGGRMKCREYDA